MKKILVALLLPFFGSAQVSITGTGSYNQDFNTLAPTGTAISWVDNSTITNWFSQRTGTGTSYDSNNGSSTAGNLYSYGTTSATERALGTLGSGGAAAGNFAHGVLFQNNSGVLISNFTVSYTLEQWRKSGVTAGQSITFWYKKSSTLISSLTPNVNTSWIQVNSLTTTSPINTATASALDGNLALNQVSLSNIAIPGLNLNVGEYLMLKWEDPDHTGADHGLAIDDVTINWTTSCNTANTIYPTSCTSYTVPSGDETYFTSGIYMDTIPNVALCDSILTIDLTISTGFTFYADNDLDGFGDPNNTTTACTVPPGYVTNNDDCDDSNILIGAASTTYYQDLDNDGYGSNVSTVACTQPVGYVTNNLDCDDSNPSINPGATDIPDNGIDEDCSGSDASAIGTQMGIYEFTQLAACPVTATSVTAQPSEAVFSNYSTSGTTCSSAANVFSNSAWNLTSTIDLSEYNQFSITANNCYTMDLNRIIFTHRISASGVAPTWILRSSVDNFISNIATGTPLTTDKTDTINLTAAFDALTTVTFRFYIINMGASGATWRNDNVRLIGNFTSLTPQTYYADADGDTYGNPSVFVTTCNQPVGYVLNNSDCNDNNANINPTTTWYQDLDGDLVGNSAMTFVGCTPPVNYVLVGGDCDDTDNSITTPIMYYVDADGDNYGNPSTGMAYCTDPGAGFTTDNTDCNDGDASINPGSPEICDNIDNNCNTDVDEGLTFINYYIDADGDNFGAGLPISMCSNPGAGYALVGGDCNDGDNTIYPGATEILNNGIDENCDGTDNYVGLEEKVAITFTVQPNPSNGIFNLHFDSTIQGTIYCIDLQGKILVVQNLNNSTTEIDLSLLSSGTYLLRVETETGIIQNRIVIQK